MRKEGTRPSGVSEVQRTVLKERLTDVLDANDKKRGSRYPFTQALRLYFDTLPIQWKRFATPIQIYSLVPSVYSALNRAFFMKNGHFIPDSALDTPEKSRDVIQNIGNDSETGDMFTSMIGELPVTYNPYRVHPLNYVLRHRFGTNPERPLALVDLGGGSGYMLPSLNDLTTIGSDGARGNRHNPTVDLHKLFGSSIDLPAIGIDHVHGDLYSPAVLLNKRFDSNVGLPIACGINVDKLTREEAIFRAKSNGDDARRSRIDKFFAQLDSRRFPHVTADLMDVDATLRKIRSVLSNYGRDFAQAVVTSFVGYQTDPKILEYLASELLERGGILVDMGDELLDYDGRLTSAVTVYQKGDSQDLDFVGMPLEIEDDGTVIRADFSYFRNPPRLCDIV